jgi:hypothetical protein
VVIQQARVVLTGDTLDIIIRRRAVRLIPHSGSMTLGWASVPE